jgi:hypothetical protein
MYPSTRACLGCAFGIAASLLFISCSRDAQSNESLGSISAGDGADDDAVQDYQEALNNANIEDVDIASLDEPTWDNISPDECECGEDGGVGAAVSCALLGDEIDAAGAKLRTIIQDGVAAQSRRNSVNNRQTALSAGLTFAGRGNVAMDAQITGALRARLIDADQAAGFRTRLADIVGDTDDLDVRLTLSSRYATLASRKLSRAFAAAQAATNALTGCPPNIREANTQGQLAARLIRGAKRNLEEAKDYQDQAAQLLNRVGTRGVQLGRDCPRAPP